MTGTLICILKRRWASWRSCSLRGRRRNRATCSQSSSFLARFMMMVGLFFWLVWFVCFALSLFIHPLFLSLFFVLCLWFSFFFLWFCSIVSFFFSFLSFSFKHLHLHFYLPSAPRTKNFEDFYRVVVLNDRSQDFSSIVAALKLEFYEYPLQISCQFPKSMFGLVDHQL